MTKAIRDIDELLGMPMPSVLRVARVEKKPTAPKGRKGAAGTQTI